MSEQAERNQASGRLQRRGLMAGVAALVGAGIGKLLGASGVEAGHDLTPTYDPSNVLHLGVLNDGGHAATDETVTNIFSQTALVANVECGTTGAELPPSRPGIPSEWR
jgi:hypothetical protein